MQQATFDPYRKWLGIAPKDQPPHYYRLLGIDLFESDSDVIANAADQRMTHVRTFQSGPHAALSQRILNEVSAARVCLLDDEKRAEYEAELREKLEPATAVPTARAATPRPESKRWRDEPNIDEVDVTSEVDVISHSENGAAAKDAKEKPLPRRAPQRAAAASTSRPAPLRKPASRSGSRTLPLLLGIGAVGVVVIGTLMYLLSQSPSSQQPLNVSTAKNVSIVKPPVVQPPPPPPRPPRIEAVGEQVVEAGKPLEFPVRAESQEQPGRRLRFTLASAPAGALIVEDMGIFRFVAPPLTAEQTWNVVVQVAVADHAEQMATTSFQLRVRPAVVTPPRPIPVVRRPGGRSPVPSPEEVAVQVALLKTEYAAEYADTSQGARQKLALKLESVAHRGEMARRYALLSQVREIATELRDIQLAQRAIQSMEINFDVGGTLLRNHAVQQIMNPAEGPEAARNGPDPTVRAEINARMIGIAAAISATIVPPKIDKPIPDKPAPIPPIAEKPPTKPGARPEFKPLQGAALTTFVRTVLKSGGRVRLEGSSNWIDREEEIPAGDDLTVIGLVLEKNVADDAKVKNISRIHSLEELTLDSNGMSSGAMHRLSDLTELTKIELTAVRMTDSFITALQEMPELRSVALHGDQLGGANVEVLAGLPKLTALEISGGRISEGTLAAVVKLEGLESLMLRGGSYSPRAIDRLQALPKLTSLNLQAFSVNDQVVTHVSELKALTRLSLEGPIAGATLPSLAKLDNLTSLSIDSSLIEEKDLTAISQLSNMKRLTLKTKPLTNGALKKLSALKKLEALDIQTKGGFNESGLKHFDGMPRLTSAHLAGLNISKEAYEKFKKDHPNTYLSPKPDWKEKGKGGPPFVPRRPPGR